MSSYYMRKSTYQKDFVPKRGQPGYDRSDLQKHIDYSKPPPFDDPMWQRGRNESSEQYEARLQEMSRHNEPDYYRTYEERKAHHGYNNPPPPMTERMHERERFEEHRPPPMDDPLWRRGRNESSEQYEDRMKGMSNRRSMEMERNHRGMGYEDGSQTSRDYKPSWLDRGNLTYRRFENHNDPKDMYPGMMAHIPKKSQEGGVYLIIRAIESDRWQIVSSLQKNMTTLHTERGHLIGVAPANQIMVSGYRGDWQNPFCLTVLWFPSASAAVGWITSAPDFKKKTFPDLYYADMVIMPIHFLSQNENRFNTFVVTEYPGIRRPVFFQDEIIEPMKNILKEYTCEPFVVNTRAISVQRGTWLPDTGMITIHRFPNIQGALQFTEDRRVKALQRSLNQLTRDGQQTTIVFTVSSTK